MISPDAIRAVVKALCAAVGISFVRAEQDGERPAGIFLSYKILTQIPEAKSGNIEEYVPTETGGLNKFTTAASSIAVSFSLNGPSNAYNDLYSLAISSLAWIESDEGLAVCELNGVYPDHAARQIRDISSILETGYESRFGFDIKFTGKAESVVSIDPVDTVVI